MNGFLKDRFREREGERSLALMIPCFSRYHQPSSKIPIPSSSSLFLSSSSSFCPHHSLSVKNIFRSLPTYFLSLVTLTSSSHDSKGKKIDKKRERKSFFSKVFVLFRPLDFDWVIGWKISWYVYSQREGKKNDGGKMKGDTEKKDAKYQRERERKFMSESFIITHKAH